jgi:hypothetical protein
MIMDIHDKISCIRMGDNTEKQIIKTIIGKFKIGEINHEYVVMFIAAAKSR